MGQKDDLPSTADIRQVLLKSFSDEELTALCFDYFRDVYNVFSTGTTKDHKIQLLIAHCVRRELVPNLLAAIERSQAEQHPAHVPSVRPEPARHERDPRQVFISHAHEDARFAHRLAEDLQRNGWHAWIAPESIRPGEKWVEAINRGLDESRVFALVLTPKAVESTWAMHEANVAIEYEHEKRLRFIPLEVERCSVPPLCRAYQRISFLGRYQDGLTELLDTLEPGRRAQREREAREKAAREKAEAERQERERQECEAKERKTREEAERRAKVAAEEAPVVGQVVQERQEPKAQGKLPWRRLWPGPAIVGVLIVVALITLSVRQLLFVTPTPTPTLTSTLTVAPTDTSTATPSPTGTATLVPTPLPTQTAAPAASLTPKISTNTPAATRIKTRTPTYTPTPPPTPTPKPPKEPEEKPLPP